MFLGGKVGRVHSGCQRHLLAGAVPADFSSWSDGRAARKLITDQHCVSVGTGVHHHVSATKWDPFPVCSGRTTIRSGRFRAPGDRDARIVQSGTDVTPFRRGTQ
jgi:hypothetical protein